MPAAKKAAKKTAGAKSTAGSALITWTRLPKGAEIKAGGAKSPDLARLLKNAKLNPRDPCFGGNTCIV